MDTQRRTLLTAIGAGLSLLGGCSALAQRFRTVEPGDGTYPQAFYDAANTNNPQTTALTTEPKVYWRYTGPGNGIPIVKNERVYFAHVALQQRDGDVAWPKDPKEGARQFGDLVLRGIPAAGDGRLYIGSHERGGSSGPPSGGVHAIDPSDGTELWYTDVGSVAERSTVADGRVYIGGNPDPNADTVTTLYAFDAASGKKQWEFTAGSRLGVPPAVVDGVAYVGGGDDGRVYALDAATGEEHWRFEPDTGTFRHAPTVMDDTVYVGGDGLYALDTADGTERWKRQIEFVGSHPPAVGDGTVYVSSGQDQLYAVDTATGEERWTNRDETVTTAPTLVEDTLYVGGGDPEIDGGAVFAFDATTGEERWRFHTRDRSKSDTQLVGLPYTPAVVDGIVYVGTKAGDVYALGG